LTGNRLVVLFYLQHKLCNVPLKDKPIKVEIYSGSKDGDKNI